MKTSLTIVTAAVGLSLLGGVAAADGKFDRQINARQAHMTMIVHGCGPLGGMLQGKVEYSPEVAQFHADNLVAATRIKLDGMWPEGSDNASNDTDALPAIWENYDHFTSTYQQLADLSLEIQAVASTDMATLGPVVKKLADTCGVCHSDFRFSDD